jgi:hypothetical protein
MSYYGLSKTSTNEVIYQGPIKNLPLGGDDMVDLINGVVKETPSAHLLVLPQMGLLIIIREDGDYSAVHFNSSMSQSTAKDLMSTLLRVGKKNNMLEEYGAIELQ